MLDLLIRGATLVTPKGEQISDIGIEDGSIALIESESSASSKATLNAKGLHLFPGIIDAHVHFNEPGRIEWEGIGTGSQAFSSGGGTLFFDMPLNSSPCTLGAKSFDLKFAAMQQKSKTDFAIWGGLVPGNIEQMENLAERGVVGFKAFMSNSGLPEFGRADDKTLFEGMQQAAKLGLPVGVHAEDEEMTSALSQMIQARGGATVRDYLDSRPIEAEVLAIEKIGRMATATGCKVHIVHISSFAGVKAALEARENGANISLETCPHYLSFTSEDMERFGAVLKCAPPLRSGVEKEKLLKAVLGGQIDSIGSDHSPSSPDLKESPNFFEVWGGISGVQFTLSAMLSVLENAPLELTAKLLCENPAKRFSIPRKGLIEQGFDADFSLIDLTKIWQPTAADSKTRYAYSPYLGQNLRGKILQTFVRGHSVFDQGLYSDTFSPRLIRPY